MKSAEGERGVLVVLRGADDGDGLWQHQLVRAVSVEVDAGEEGRLCGMGLKDSRQRSHDADGSGFGGLL